MKNSYISILFITLLAMISGFVTEPMGHAAKSCSQDAEKSLEIERYPHEPLQLVDIKVSEQSVKNRIEVKSRTGDEGLDYVKFKDKDEWFKRVSVRLRNVSGKPIIGLRAYLYFKVSTTPTLLRMPLARSRPLEVAPLEPDGEIDLMVSEDLWKQMASVLQRYGNANQASVTLAVENIMFSDGFQWNREHLLRQDPANPNRWIPMKISGRE